MLPFSHFLSFSVAFQLTVRLKSLPSEAAMSRQTSAVFRRTALSVMTRWVVEFPSNEKSGWKLWMRPGRKRTTTSRSITACLAAMMQDEEEGIWIATVYFTQLSNSLSLPVFTFLHQCSGFVVLFLTPKVNWTETGILVIYSICPTKCGNSTIGCHRNNKKSD